MCGTDKAPVTLVPRSAAPAPCSSGREGGCHGVSVPPQERGGRWGAVVGSPTGVPRGGGGVDGRMAAVGRPTAAAKEGRGERGRGRGRGEGGPLVQGTVGAPAPLVP